MIDRDTPLRNDLSKVAARHALAQVEEDRVQNDVAREVGTLERDHHRILPIMPLHSANCSSG